MGLFEDIGRKVETFKQQAESVSQGRARAKCPECDTLVYTDREDCPDCGHDQLLIRKPESDEDDDADADEADADEADADEADADEADADEADDGDTDADVDDADDGDTDADADDADDGDTDADADETDDTESAESGTEDEAVDPDDPSK